MTSKCPKCGATMQDEWLDITFDMGWGNLLTQRVLCERCPKCEWHRPYEYFGNGKCPKCDTPIYLVCEKCGHDITDFMPHITTTLRDWAQKICRCCDNFDECRYLCSAFLVIRKLVREGKLNPAAKYGGIPLYTGLKNRNPFSKIRS